jgi:hypothetical protein
MATLSPGAIAGLVIGCVAALLLCAGLVGFIVRRKRVKRSQGWEDLNLSVESAISFATHTGEPITRTDSYLRVREVNPNPIGGEVRKSCDGPRLSCLH